MSDQRNTVLVGIDGGGTGCRVAITTAQGAPLGTAKGGPSNPTYKPQVALENILTAIEAARVDAGLDTETLNNAHALIGLAGIRNDEIADFIASALPIRQATVVEDRITTVTGALSGGDGAVAAIGTGSFVARSANGHTDYIGGWGFRLGDQASGAWLGHNLLRQVILCAEGVGPHSALTHEILAKYHGNGHEIYDFCNTATPAQFGELAPQVVDAATKGDENALALMQEGAEYIEKALIALGYQSDSPLCLTGGLGPHYTAFLPPDYAAHVVSPKGTALDGALLLAAQMGAEP